MRVNEDSPQTCRQRALHIMTGGIADIDRLFWSQIHRFKQNLKGSWVRFKCSNLTCHHDSLERGVWKTSCHAPPLARTVVGVGQKTHTQPLCPHGRQQFQRSGRRHCSGNQGLGIVREVFIRATNVISRECAAKPFIVQPEGVALAQFHPRVKGHNLLHCPIHKAIQFNMRTSPKTQGFECRLVCHDVIGKGAVKIEENGTHVGGKTHAAQYRRGRFSW